MGFQFGKMQLSTGDKVSINCELLGTVDLYSDEAGKFSIRDIELSGALAGIRVTIEFDALLLNGQEINLSDVLPTEDIDKVGLQLLIRKS